jgi:hypothetical protein
MRSFPMKNIVVIIAIAGLSLMALPTDSSGPVAANALTQGQAVGLVSSMILKANQWCGRVVDGLLNAATPCQLAEGDNGNGDEEEKKDEEKKDEAPSEDLERLWSVVQFG